MNAPFKIPEVPHSSNGASSADRWINCPGSNNLIQSIPKADMPKSGFAANEGTAAHFIGLNHCLERDLDAWEMVGEKVQSGDYTFEVDAGMADAIQVLLDYVRLRQKEYPTGILKIERSLQHPFIAEAFGQADVTFEVPGVFLEIVDYKHGIGVSVEPSKPQTKYYGHLVCLDCDHDYPTIILTIIQPRCPHPKGPIRHYETTSQELEDFFNEIVIPAIEKTHDPNAPLSVGEHCKFCPGKSTGRCPALKGAVTEVPIELEPDFLTTEEIGELLNRKKAIDAFFEALETEAFRRAQRGEAVPFHKLVRKQANRCWREGAEAVLLKELGDDAYQPRKFKSPAMVEEQLPNGISYVTKYAFKPDAGLTIAHVSDKRDAVVSRMEEFLMADSAT
jgi:hypothetical protein